MKWEGKWAEENWGCWYIGTTRRLFLSLSGSNPFFFIHFAKFRSSSKIAGMNSLRNAISQDAAGDSWVILICHLHTHPVHTHCTHTQYTETLKHSNTYTLWQWNTLTRLHRHCALTHVSSTLTRTHYKLNRQDQSPPQLPLHIPAYPPSDTPPCQVELPRFPTKLTTRIVVISPPTPNHITTKIGI